MWFEESVFYQIYPFGFCGAPEYNDGVQQNRISKVEEWIPHIKKLGANALYFCPVFESDKHGYDTKDYTKLDCRLGTNQDFTALCNELHENGIRVVLDAVFNHVGRGFWAFKDVLEKKQNSEYKDWFYIDFNREGQQGDGFYYEGWEGHYSLVRLNLNNPAVVEHLFAAVRAWVQEFDIDGLRLDVAYVLDEGFLKKLHIFCKELKTDFLLLGEAIHGDYTRIVNSEMLHSCTNYECYKGVYSSFNDGNMFEIAHSLNRQFGAEEWTLYKGLNLLNFLDNHDVERIASILKNEKHLKTAYALMYGMAGMPCIYYGSEWGAKGKKEKNSDASIRPCFDNVIENELSAYVGLLSKIRLASPALMHGGYKQVYLKNLQFVFCRTHASGDVFVAINADENAHTADISYNGRLLRLSDNEEISCNGEIEIEPYSAEFFLCLS